MSKVMTFRYNSREIVFDDFYSDSDIADSIWVEICPRCLDNYRSAFGNRVDEGAGAMGTCSVRGCMNEADSYVDFKKDEVGIDVLLTTSRPIRYPDYSISKIASHIFQNAKNNDAFSIYRERSDGVYFDEHIILCRRAEDSNQTVEFWANSRDGGKVTSISGSSEETFQQDFDAYVKQVYGEDKPFLHPLPFEFIPNKNWLF